MSAELSWEDSVRRMQDDPTRIALVRESYYDRDVVEAARRFEQSEEWAATRDLLPERPGHGTAVDLGAGRGVASYALAHAGWSVVAVEPDPGATVGRGAIVSLSDQSALNVRVCPGTAEAILLENASVDFVYARAVLHHTADMVRACREIARILKPGGRLLAVREHVVNRLEDEKEFLAGHDLHSLYGGEHAFTLATYRGAIEQSGLNLIRVLGSYDSPINYAPYTRQDVWGLCAHSLIRLVGWRMARTMAGPDSHVGRWLMRSRGERLSQRDTRPGRLYSFVAEKS